MTPWLRNTLLYLVPFVLLAFGLWGNWPWLRAEHDRLEPWKVPLIWGTEAVALFWYLHFGLGRLAGAAPDPRRVRRPVALIVLSFAIGISADVAVSLFSMFEENAAHARAAPANGRILVADVRRLRNGETLCTLACDFVDAQGNRHEATFFVGRPALPPAVDRALAAGALPVPLDVTYDPSWPGRSWVVMNVDPHHNRMYYMSFAVILFATLFSVGLLAMRYEAPTRLLPPEQICPFVAVSLVLACAGVGKLLLGEV